VLKRIDNIPNLKPQERSQLYAAVQKAKEMMKVITIPFALGQKTLSPPAVEKLCEACHAPEVQKLVKNPTVVFVILGFADTIGSTESGMKLSTARAETVSSTLHDHCKLLNRLQPVGMGSSEFFGVDKKEKNRVVEVWVVIP
jgi:outer membrane protein OmpA-like peptidoglycan-associated protein